MPSAGGLRSRSGATARWSMSSPCRASSPNLRAELLMPYRLHCKGKGDWPHAGVLTELHGGDPLDPPESPSVWRHQPNWCAVTQPAAAPPDRRWPATANRRPQPGIGVGSRSRSRTSMLAAAASCSRGSRSPRLAAVHSPSAYQPLVQSSRAAMVVERDARSRIGQSGSGNNDAVVGLDDRDLVEKPDRCRGGIGADLDVIRLRFCWLMQIRPADRYPRVRRTSPRRPRPRAPVRSSVRRDKSRRRSRCRR